MDTTILHTLASWHAASDSCRTAFTVAMQGRWYGPQETADAWEWFDFGFSAALEAVCP